MNRKDISTWMDWSAEVWVKNELNFTAFGYSAKHAEIAIKQKVNSSTSITFWFE